jgi:uncharacterized protein (TIGR00251 family)
MVTNIEKYVVDNRLRISVKPNAPRNQVLGYANGTLKVAIAAPAERNKANTEIIKFFRKLLGRDVEIVHGLHSKTKTLRIV